MVIFSEHSLEKMRERHISRERVIRVLERGRRVPSYAGRQAARGVVDDIDTEVIFFVRDDGTIIVITTYDELGSEWRPVV